MSKLSEFIAYLKEQIGQPYVWGGQHTKLTPENYIRVIEEKEKKTNGSYSDGTSYADAAKDYCKKKFEKGAEVLFAYDCSGLGCYWLYNLNHLYKSDVNANTMMCRCTGVNSSDPPKKGWWVFRLNGSKASHIGYMIDDEYLIEAKGRKYGVVKSKWKEKDWHCWGVPKVFENDIIHPVDDPSEHPKKYVPTQSQSVKVIRGKVNVRASDQKKGNKPIGKILFTAKKGESFDLINIASSGWYHIDTRKGPAYITDREDLTKLV